MVWVVVLQGWIVQGCASRCVAGSLAVATKCCGNLYSSLAAVSVVVWLLQLVSEECCGFAVV